METILQHSLIPAIAQWYQRQSEKIDDGTYKCIRVPKTPADDVINVDENGNLGFWLVEVLYCLLDDSAPEGVVDAIWSSITGIPLD